MRVGGEKRNFIGPRGGAGDDSDVRAIITLVSSFSGLEEGTNYVKTKRQCAGVVPKKAHHVTRHLRVLHPSVSQDGGGEMVSGSLTLFIGRHSGR